MPKVLAGALTGAGLICLLGAPARAGVVIAGTNTQSGNGPAQTRTQVVMIQGHRERIESGPQVTVIDADRGTVLVLNQPTRTYAEGTFKPRPAGAQAPAAPPPVFHPTGATRTIAGYRCGVFTASSTGAQGDRTITGCFSTAVPGWREYRDFNALLARKTGTDTGNAGFPPGLPLSVVTSLKAHYHLSDKIQPARRNEIERQLEARAPQVSEDTVSSIKAAKLAPALFAVPSGYTRLRLAGPLEQ